MKKLLFVLVIFTITGWTHGSGVMDGPFTVTNPFSITLPPSFPQVGATVSPSAVGGFRTRNNVVCNIAATPFNLSPAVDNDTNQFLVGNDDCSVSVVSRPNSLGFPADMLQQLFYPAIQAPRVVTIAVGDGVTTQFAALGGEAAPGGGTYGILPVFPVNNTVTVTAGAVTGTDAGTLLSNGKMNITGSGISACTIVVLINNTYNDNILSTHAGYYDCTFDVAPSNGVPITITLQYTWAPPSHSTATPNFDSSGAYSMFRSAPSADDPVARLRAYQVMTRTFNGSEIAVLDPSVYSGIQQGKTPIFPCVDMASNCTHTGANSNYAAIVAACPENTVGNTYSWNAATKALGLTAAGTLGAQRTYSCFKTEPGKLDASVSFVTISNNSIDFSGLGSPRYLGSNQIIEFNKYYTSDFNPTILHILNKGACIAMNSFGGTLANNIIRNNELLDCGNDGIDTVNTDGLIITQNRIEVNGGLEFGQHPDGFQSQGSGGGNFNRNMIISKNYVTCYTRFNAQLYLRFVNGARIQSQCNASIYVQEFGSDTTENVSVTKNFSDGGVFGFMFGINVSPPPNISLTDNISGTGMAYPPRANGPFHPSPQVGNINAYSGAAENVW